VKPQFSRIYSRILDYEDDIDVTLRSDGVADVKIMFTIDATRYLWAGMKFSLYAKGAGPVEDDTVEMIAGDISLGDFLLKLGPDGKVTKNSNLIGKVREFFTKIYNKILSILS